MNSVASGKTILDSMQDADEALEYITGMECYSAWEYVYEESVLQSLLDDNIPVIVTRGVYKTTASISDNSSGENAGKERTGGHATVIASYRWSATKNDYEYVIYDPWPVQSGVIVYMTYEEICDGNSSGVDKRIWDGIITYAQGAYLTTEPWNGA